MMKGRKRGGRGGEQGDDYSGSFAKLPCLLVRFLAGAGIWIENQVGEGIQLDVCTTCEGRAK